MDRLCGLSALAAALRWLVEAMYLDARRVCVLHGCLVGVVERVYAEAVQRVGRLESVIRRLGECVRGGSCDATSVAREAMAEARRAVAAVAEAAGRLRAVLEEELGGAARLLEIDFREYAYTAAKLLPLITAWIADTAGSTGSQL